MTRAIDVNERNQRLVVEIREKAMRAMGAVRSVGEMSRGYMPLTPQQVDTIKQALEHEVNEAIRVLKAASEKKESAPVTLTL